MAEIEHTARLMKILSLVVLVLIATGVGFWFAAGELLSRPVPEMVGSAPMDLNAENVEVPNDSGATVHAWWCLVPESRAAVILLPNWLC